jgi:hypothetical protein
MVTFLSLAIGAAVKTHEQPLLSYGVGRLPSPHGWDRADAGGVRSQLRLAHTGDHFSVPGAV